MHNDPKDRPTFKVVLYNLEAIVLPRPINDTPVHIKEIAHNPPPILKEENKTIKHIPNTPSDHPNLASSFSPTETPETIILNPKDQFTTTETVEETVNSVLSDQSAPVTSGEARNTITTSESIISEIPTIPHPEIMDKIPTVSQILSPIPDINPEDIKEATNQSTAIITNENQNHAEPIITNTSFTLDNNYFQIQTINPIENPYQLNKEDDQINVSPQNRDEAVEIANNVQNPLTQDPLI